MTCDTPELRRAYEDRAHLLSVLAAIYPSWLVASPDGDRPVLYLQIPTGQVSWHVDHDDVHLFEHVHHANPGDPDAPDWDGHTRDVKHERLAALTRSLW